LGWKEDLERNKENGAQNRFAKNHYSRRNSYGIWEIPQADKVLQNQIPLFLMKLISWNVRGLNSPSKHRMLKNLIQQEKPTLVFLQETKSNSVVIERILNKVWFRSCSVSVDASGASGGLAILWNPQILNLQDFHASHFLIQATFHLIGTNIHGHLSNVYFPQNIQQKLYLLDTLTTLNSKRQFPLWIGGGDFNIITASEEKTGGRSKLDSDNSGFKDFIQRNQLMDMQTSNGIYTWTNKRRGS